jgi:hypothetical protein
MGGPLTLSLKFSFEEDDICYTRLEKDCQKSVRTCLLEQYEDIASLLRTRMGFCRPSPAAGDHFPPFLVHA